MHRLSQTWSLMKASWGLLKQDKELLVFPLISGICCLIVLASFALPLYASGAWEPPAQDASAGQQIAYYGMLFLFYFCNYFVIVFFNAAVIACAAIRMGGGNPTLSDGFRAAMGRLHLIAGWALVAATVGMILRIIEDRSQKVGQIVVGLIGMAWSVVSFLVIPILVIEEKGPITALKESTAMLRQTWGQQLIGNFSFGLIFFLLGIPAFLILALGIAAGSSAVLLLCGVIAAIYLIVLALIQSALQAIFQAALYYYARKGQIPQGFDGGTLQGAMSPR